MPGLCLAPSMIFVVRAYFRGSNKMYDIYFIPFPAGTAYCRECGGVHLSRLLEVCYRMMWVRCIYSCSGESNCWKKVRIILQVTMKRLMVKTCGIVKTCGMGTRCRSACLELQRRQVVQQDGEISIYIFL